MTVSHLALWTNGHDVVVEKYISEIDTLIITDYQLCSKKIRINLDPRMTKSVRNLLDTEIREAGNGVQF